MDRLSTIISPLILILTTLLVMAALLWIGDLDYFPGRPGYGVTYVANIHPDSNEVQAIGDKSLAVFDWRKGFGDPDTTKGGPFGVAVTPDQSRLYVTNQRSGVVQMFYAAVTTNPWVISVCKTDTCNQPDATTAPKGIAIRLDGKRAFVALNGTSSTLKRDIGSHVVVIDTDRSSNTYNRQIAVITLPDPKSARMFNGEQVKNGPLWIVADPKGRYIFVSSYYTDGLKGTVSYIDANTFKVADTRPTDGDGTFALSVDPKGEYLWIANEKSHTVTKQEITTGKNTIYAGFDWPKATLVVGNDVYVTNYGCDSQACIAGGKGPRSPTVQELKAWQNTNPGCTSYENDNNVMVINALEKPQQMYHTIPIEPGKTGNVCGMNQNQPCARSGPTALALSASGDKVWVGGFDNRSLSYIDTQTKKVVATIAVGHRPIGIASGELPESVPAWCFRRFEVCVLTKGKGGWRLSWDPLPAELPLPEPKR